MYEASEGKYQQSQAVVKEAWREADYARVLYRTRSTLQISLGRGYWVTLDGRYLKLKEMTTEHIRNSLLMLNRVSSDTRTSIQNAWIIVFEKELYNRILKLF